MLFIRLLCSLLTTVCITVSNIICQIAVLSFFISNLHYCVSGHSVPFLSVSQLLSQNKANCSLLAFDKENSIESPLDFVTNFIQSYLHQFFKNSHSLNSYRKPSKRPFNRCQLCLEAINIGWDIKQINW